MSQIGMSIEECAANIGAHVWVKHQDGGRESPGKIVSVENRRVNVSLPGRNPPVETRDPHEIRFWKAKNAMNGVALKEPKPTPATVPTKAKPIEAKQPPTITPLPLMLERFDDARRELDEYRELVTLCRADLKQAEEAESVYVKQVDELRKDIKARIDLV